MPEITPVETVETPKAKTPKGKKSAKVAPKASANGHVKSDLRKPQLRILKALEKKSPMSRVDISKKAPVDVAACVEYIGSHDDAVRKANDKKHFPSLITLGYVRFANSEDEAAQAYELTANGRKRAAKD